MATVQFDRDKRARWYAKEHLKTDPGIAGVYYLPNGSGEREIRFVEINNLMGNRNNDVSEPIDFGVDTGSEDAHRLLVLDVTPEQWEHIRTGALQLPEGWTLDGAEHFTL